MLIFKKKYLFFDLINLWLDTKKNIKIQSYQKYENLANLFIKNSIGNIDINLLTKEDILCFFKNLQDKKVSISTQKILLYIIKATLQMAYQKKKCNYIDLSDIKIKSPVRNTYILSKEDQLKLEHVLKEDINIRKTCLLLCLYTGLRIGEVCGLKWEDINFNTKSLEVKRTIERIKNNEKNSHLKTILIESTPKSDTSNRIIPIPNFLIQMLQKLKTEDKYFLLSNKETLYDPRLFNYFYKNILKKSNITYTNFHTLRHTFATRSIESKMDIKTLSEILGHSNVDITLRLYVHPSYELKKKSIENLVNFMTN